MIVTVGNQLCRIRHKIRRAGFSGGGVSRHRQRRELGVVTQERIPKETKEALRVGGAGRWRRREGVACVSGLGLERVALGVLDRVE